ncbi:MAG: arginine--tRNA ligase [Thermoleophilaceae bacterium]|nr:arginine--tRNA ligase [Thermoleophilaceae bacterium]
MPSTADPLAELHAAVAAVAADLRGSVVELPDLGRPPKPEFGDYSTNAAMLLAPELGSPPRAVAEQLGERLGEVLGDRLERIEIAGPGFLNLFVSDRWLRGSLARIGEAGDLFGSGPAGERILVEFVSANPTGPITVAAARHAAYGDSLCRILELAGHAVEREYYVNDYGSQVRRFGESLIARARGEEPPEDGYQGGYVVEIAARIEGAGAPDADPDQVAARGVGLILGGVRATLERFGVDYDRYFSELSLHESGAITAAIEALNADQRVYPHEDATWLRTTEFGDDKDRVLQRGSGELTYFAADIAYHLDKRSRDHERVINVWGADHHGYIGRMQAAWQALGGAEGSLEVIVMQLVNLRDGGAVVQMSKRAGDIVTLDDLLDDIGVDAARFFLVQRSHDTTLDLDLALAREQSQDNPVYYVQYAHARIASILRKAGTERVEQALAADLAGSAEVPHPSARTMIMRLLAFPGEIALAAERRAPHRLTTYALETAQDFSAFYRDCRVVGAAEEGGDEDLRIALSEHSRRLLERTLDLLGVAAPSEM